MSQTERPSRSSPFFGRLRVILALLFLLWDGSFPFIFIFWNFHFMDNWHEFLHNLSNFVYSSIRIFKNFSLFLLKPCFDFLDGKYGGFFNRQLIHLLQYLIYTILLIIFFDFIIFLCSAILFQTLLHIFTYGKLARKRFVIFEHFVVKSISL